VSIFKKRMTVHDHEDQLTLIQISNQFEEIFRRLKSIENDLYPKDRNDTFRNVFPIVRHLDNAFSNIESLQGLYSRVCLLEDK
jgi:hypothetical protein